MTSRNVLYKLRKITSGTKHSNPCSSSLLLTKAPDLTQRYTAKNGVRVEVGSAHETSPLWRLQNTLLLFTPLAATTFEIMSRDYHVHVLLSERLQECRSGRDSAALRGGTASHGSILDFPCGFKDESFSAQRCRCGIYFRSNSFSSLLVTLLSVILRLDATWKS